VVTEVEFRCRPPTPDWPGGAGIDLIFWRYRGHQRDPALDELDEPFVVEAVRRRLEHGQTAHVHGRRRSFQIEEGHVQRFGADLPFA